MPSAGRLGDRAQVPADAHGCPGCPHPGVGPAIIGCPTVLINNMPALRIGDQGIHSACCGPNMWRATGGSGTVIIGYSPAHRMSDTTMHCGGVGMLIEGSPNVVIGG